MVELLVVISTIAILASLLLPALSRAKQAAEKATCINNERQMGLALRLYLDDQGVYPSDHPWYLDYPMPSWYSQLEPYVKDKWPTNNLLSPGNFASVRGVFSCPGFSRLPGWYANRADWATLESGAYAYNSAYFGTEITNTVGLVVFSAPPPRLGRNRVGEIQIANPSEMIAIGDSPLRHVNFEFDPPGVRNGSIGAVRYSWNGSDLGVLNYHSRRHGGQFEILFCDGHVRSFSDTGLFSKAELWNRDNQSHW